MINSTLIEQKAAVLFLFSPIETGLFQLERALPTPGRHQTILDPFDGCLVLAHHWQGPYNRKHGFYPDEVII